MNDHVECYLCQNKISHMKQWIKIKQQSVYFLREACTCSSCLTIIQQVAWHFSGSACLNVLPLDGSMVSLQSLSTESVDYVAKSTKSMPFATLSRADFL